MQLFRYLSLAGTLILLPIVFVWRPLLQRRRQGSWGVVLFKGGAEQNLRAYGEQYGEYARRVGRLLPGIGKLG